MQNNGNINTESTIIRDILNEFLKRIQNDQAIPEHVHAALEKHFAEKTSISPQEIKLLLSSRADLS